jgi:predicted AAA+ superfamily ATPase
LSKFRDHIMYRNALADLKNWKNQKNRKPLVLRGARQVGKTWLVREFAKEDFDHVIEINFDETPEQAKLFVKGDVDRCLQLLEMEHNQDIIPDKTLIFLDEIQAVPEILPYLRYFYEKRPDIFVIAAGSLLEFLLYEHDFSMPVGRIEYLHLGPMTIEEFLLALDQPRLVSFLTGIHPHESIPESIHLKLLDFLKLFWIVGGMPAAVIAYKDSKSLRHSNREHGIILQTYEDDFSKYRKRIYPQRIRKVFQRIPALVGKKLKYVNLDSDERSKDLADTLYLLEMARVIFRVHHSSGNGVPLGGEMKAKDFKPLFLDTGLMAQSLGLNLAALQGVKDLTMVNNGAVAEQFIGQHLLYQNLSYVKPELYYWNREKKSSSAEVDYLISINNVVIPVEVKAGTSGSLKSLQVFLSEKRAPAALRFNSMAPSLTELTVKITGTPGGHPYLFLSLPHYLVCQAKRLLKEVMG